MQQFYKNSIACRQFVRGKKHRSYKKKKHSEMTEIIPDPEVNRRENRDTTPQIPRNSEFLEKNRQLFQCLRAFGANSVARSLQGCQSGEGKLKISCRIA